MCVIGTLLAVGGCKKKSTRCIVLLMEAPPTGWTTGYGGRDAPTQRPEIASGLLQVRDAGNLPILQVDHEQLTCGRWG
jgi:hypothetical protein